MIDYISFDDSVKKAVKLLPSEWRYGQKVFNYIDNMYGVARDVQFIDKCDCFYNDDNVNRFITLAWMRVCEKGEGKKTIKIDIDGVLRDIVKEMCILYNEKTKSNLKPEDVNEYECYKIFTKVDNPRKFFFYDNAARIFGNAEMYDGVKEAIDRLRDGGFKVILATYQDTYEAKKITLEWLEKHDINYDSILFTNSTDKSDIVASYVVDDCPEILMNEMKDGVVRVCIDRPYNHSDDNSEIRVNSLMELAEKHFYLIGNGEKTEDRRKENRDRIGCPDQDNGGTD